MKKTLILLLSLSLALFFYLQERKFTQSTIYIGTSLPKTSVLKEYGASVENGMNTYFHYINSNNLLNGKKIQLIAYDDKYEPKLTLENTYKLLQNSDIFALLGFVGTPTVKNILPLIHAYDIPFIGTFSGASFLRENSCDHIINFRTSYLNEIQTHIHYLHTVKKFTKIAVFYQNDEYGEDGYIAVVNTLKKYDLSLVAEGNYKRNTLSIRHAFNSIKEAQPEAIIMIGANKANTLFIKEAQKNPKFTNTIFSNISFGDASYMTKELGNENPNIIFSQVVPNFQDMSLLAVQEYHTLSKQYNPDFKPNFVAFEAFLNAKVFVKALQNIEGDLTRSKFFAAYRSLKEDTLQDIPIDASQKDLLDSVYLFSYKNKQFIKIQE